MPEDAPPPMQDADDRQQAAPEPPSNLEAPPFDADAPPDNALDWWEENEDDPPLATYAPPDPSGDPPAPWEPSDGAHDRPRPPRPEALPELPPPPRALTPQLSSNFRAQSRVQPHDLQAEQAVLGAILVDPQSIHVALDSLKPEDFYHPAHQLIFRSMQELADRSLPIDMVTLPERLQTAGHFERIGGWDLLIELAQRVPSSANIKHYVDIISQKRVMRDLIEVCSTTMQEAYVALDPEATLDSAERRILEIGNRTSDEGLVQLKTPLMNAYNRLEALSVAKSEITGTPTGIVRLDKMTAGLQPSDLIIVAGRPSMGKTAFAIGIAMHAAVYAEKSVAIFSLEMSKESLAVRMLASDGRIDATRMRTGQLEHDDWRLLHRTANRLSRAKIYIDESTPLFVQQVRSRCRRLQSDHGLDLVMVDYLQLMQGSPNAQSREQEIAEISRGLKGLAKELNVPVVALSQLNRSVESRSDRRPGLADLRESGAIEQDADVIMFVYRDEVYNKDTDAKGFAEIIVGKQRNGPIGKAPCRFVHQYTRFENAAFEELPPSLQRELQQEG